MNLGICLSYQHELSQSLVLCQAISDAVITPDGICPKCKHVNSEEEIRDGWNDDPHDFTTRCVNCNHRFVSSLDVEGDSDVLPTGHYDFLCPDQLYTNIEYFLAERGRSLLGQQFILKNRPDLFWNMIRHNGNYKLGLAAFKRWQKK